MAKPPKAGAALPVIAKAVTQDRVQRYAEASGDFNPIHLDPGFAAASQFGRTIAHGMLVAASISEMMVAAFGAHWARAGRLKIRFRAPVFPGETVEAFGQVKEVAAQDGGYRVTCAVGVRKASGELAITGDATVVLPADR